MKEQEYDVICIGGGGAGVTAAQDARQKAKPETSDRLKNTAVEKIEKLFGVAKSNRPITLIRRLQETMWRNVGPARDGQRCYNALNEIDKLKQEANNLRTAGFRKLNTEVVDAIELRAMITTAEIIALSALERRESRGAHCRTDSPDFSETSLPENLIVRKDPLGMLVTSNSHTNWSDD